jgi:hypothetical protein
MECPQRRVLAERASTSPCDPASPSLDGFVRPTRTASAPSPCATNGWAMDSVGKGESRGDMARSSNFSYPSAADKVPRSISAPP